MYLFPCSTDALPYKQFCTFLFLYTILIFSNLGCSGKYLHIYINFEAWDIAFYPNKSLGNIFE